MAQLLMIRHRDGNRGVRKPLLHHHMAASPSDFDVTVPLKNAAYLTAGQHSQSSQRAPPAEL